MIPRTLIKGFDKRRLRILLLLFFLGLAVPTAVLIGQAYTQLKWEAFHQYRGLAEELTVRIDDRLTAMVNAADERSFTDYAFLVVVGDPSANLVQRSVLAAYPVSNALPGTIGYFQVDADGTFSTPILPAEGDVPEELGISGAEYANRLQLAQELQSILADNRLVKVKTQSRLELGRSFASSPKPAAASEFEEDKDTVEEIIVTGSSASQSAAEPVPLEEAAYSQQVFDRLNQPRENIKKQAIPVSVESSDGPRRLEDNNAAPLDEIRTTAARKVTDLKLDAALEKKSEDAERSDALKTSEPGLANVSRARQKRLEQSALPASGSFGKENTFADAPDLMRISTFESEIDPLEFSTLGSGHIVLFRNVWRDGKRFIQGLIINQAIFIDDVVTTAFRDTALASMSDLIIANQDDVILTVLARNQSRYLNGNGALDGTLLYRNRLSAPLESLELIYSITRLPPGPGASILGWVTLVLALIFSGGFLALYRLGTGQIQLAQQQQDFVSSVSHELKTPLTSIRLYGEMLKEGWADEDKKQGYYEFIHDESERLTRLISNVLQLARITHNDPQFDMRPTKVGELMSLTESRISNQVQRAGFELEFRRDDDAETASVVVDSDCFSQIIINLVDNAIKFSKDAATKRIEISSHLNSEKAVVFTVRDFGPGIPRDQMKKIFTLFYRSESELTRETVGTGIGLAIVHQLAIGMGAKVDVVNKDPGAEFRLVI